MSLLNLFKKKDSNNPKNYGEFIALLSKHNIATVCAKPKVSRSLKDGIPIGTFMNCPSTEHYVRLETRVNPELNLVYEFVTNRNYSDPGQVRERKNETMGAGLYTLLSAKCALDGIQARTNILTTLYHFNGEPFKTKEEYTTLFDNVKKAGFPMPPFCYINV